MKTTQLTIATICILALAASARAAELYVPSEYATIQAAIDAAYDGDTVIVADGIYTDDGNHDIDFLGKAITVKSENGPENCIIDCNGTEDDRHRGFHFHSGEDTNSVLDGFTITNGHIYHGGGIYCRDSSPHINNCIVTQNRGGGFYCFSESSPVISRCTINNNTGGGIRGSSKYTMNPIVNNCNINNNTDSGIRFDGMYNLRINNCQISGNTGEYGGGIICSRGTMKVTNTLITGNVARVGVLSPDGGAIFCPDGRAIITNCTIAHNKADKVGGITTWGGSATVSNCVIWGNFARQIDGTATVIYSNVQDGWEGEGNIDVEPSFMDPGYWYLDDNGTPGRPKDDYWDWGDGDYR